MEEEVFSINLKKELKVLIDFSQTLEIVNKENKLKVLMQKPNFLQTKIEKKLEVLKGFVYKTMSSLIVISNNGGSLGRKVLIVSEKSQIVFLCKVV